MSTSQEIEQLKKQILSESNSEKQKLIEKLIEIEGFEAMPFIQSLFLIDPFHRNPENKNLISIAAYGVKKLLKLRAIESIDEFKFCPHCKSPLNKYEIIDPYSIGLKCPNNHRFHIEIQQNEFYEKNLKVNKDNYLEIAKEWLTNEDFRKNIHSQIAEILRRYVELHETNNKYNERNILNNYCPVCSLSLQKFKQDDVWVEGLKCTNDHVFYSRNGLTYKNSTLITDIDKTKFEFLINSYLTGEQKEQLPNQIITLFTIMRETSN
jgi:hypothetical protein